jgi:hypothetical protein
MTKWWQEGYEFAKSKNPVRYCHIPEQKIHRTQNIVFILIIVDKISLRMQNNYFNDTIIENYYLEKLNLYTYKRFFLAASFY